jgi:hypothetical protein
MDLEFFFYGFPKSPQILNLMKIRQVGAESSHVDGHRDRQTERHDEANMRVLQILRIRLKIDVLKVMFPALSEYLKSTELKQNKQEYSRNIRILRIP